MFWTEPRAGPGIKRPLGPTRAEAKLLRAVLALAFGAKATATDDGVDGTPIYAQPRSRPAPR